MDSILHPSYLDPLKYDLIVPSNKRSDTWFTLATRMWQKWGCTNSEPRSRSLTCIYLLFQISYFALRIILTPFWGMKDHVEHRSLTSVNAILNQLSTCQLATTYMSDLSQDQLSLVTTSRIGQPVVGKSCR